MSAAPEVSPGIVKPGDEESGGRPAVAAPDGAPAGTRLISLDAFRGITIIGMLLVNNVALDDATPEHFRHADWSGAVNFADLVFPWFLFIVGVAVPWAAASWKRRGLPGWRYAMKAAGRCLSLVALGCLVDSALAHRPTLGLGVLQVIGLAYLGGALLGGLPVAARLGVAMALLAGHWAALRFVPIPGVGPGAFTEEQNLVRHLNETYLAGFGLKGLVSVVPTTAMVLLGTAAGDWLRAGRPRGRTAAGLAGVGAALVCLGWLWSLDLPFNKPLWTAPYIVFTAGLAGLALAPLHLLLDGNSWGPRIAYPLVVLGSNAIVAYVAPILTKVWVLQDWTWQMADGSRLPLQQALLHTAIEAYGRVGGGWAYTLGYVLWWWVVLWILHRRGWLFRV